MKLEFARFEQERVEDYKQALEGYIDDALDGQRRVSCDFVLLGNQMLKLATWTAVDCRVGGLSQKPYHRSDPAPGNPNQVLTRRPCVLTGY